MRISVVVPTMLRSSLEIALRSIRNQSVDCEIEILLVVDTPDADTVPDDVGRLADAVIFTGGIGGAAARNAGIAASTGEFVAFLDDDDEWLPGRLKDQLDLLKGRRGEFVVTCRVRQGDRADGVLSVPVPSRFWRGESLLADEYLFRRRQPSIGRAVIYTSTLLVSADLAKRVPWTTGLKRHQDWDWLMKLSREGGVRFLAAEQVGVHIWMNSTGSLSASDDWRSSLEWITGWSPKVSRAVVVDFLAAQTLRYAMQGRSWRGVAACVAAMWATRRLPAPGCLAIGVAGLVPRARLSRMVVRG